MYNKKDVEEIIEEHFTETPSSLEHSPLQSNPVRPRSSTLDRMTSTVGDPEENNPRCNNICNIM